MESVRDQILKCLGQLIGLKLSIARRAADMRIFHFGNITIDEIGSSGEFALHIQCPWRIEGPDGIVTGRTDLWEPADEKEEIDWDTWDYDKNENLQDKLIGDLLGGYDARPRSAVNNGESLVVEGIEADDFGGATIFLSGAYRIVIFPAGSAGEDWRFFRPSSEEEHLVISGGKIEEPVDTAD